VPSDTTDTTSPEERAKPTAEAAPVKESRRAAIWREIKGLAWVLLAVLLFHSFVAKPFYIPSESMMPVLLKGDRLVVTKYPYGYSFVSPTIPNPAAIFRTMILRGPPEPWGITLPFMEGRLFGHAPRQGDVVIVVPPGSNEDYIKRVIGLPGDVIELKAGRLHINDRQVRSEVRPPARIPVDPNAPCDQLQFSGQYAVGPDGRPACLLPIVRETLPNGVSYDTVELGPSPGDDFGPLRVPPGHVFLMGDNRDRSADSRFALGSPTNGLGGPVPIENIGGRAEFITFSLDGTTGLNPLTWISSFRSGRAGDSLRGDTAVPSQ
jgi:signal peptidase I